ncbi:MAG: class I SAM-dependent methyltransferase [Candidatus Dormibacteria bacterium]
MKKCVGGPRIRTSLTDLEGATLQRLAAGGDVVEFGAAYGYSTVVIAQVALSVISVDPHTALPGSRDILLRNLWQCGVLHRVTVVDTTSEAFCGRAYVGSADLVFIDGNHSTEATIRDLQCANRLLRGAGHIAIHDYTRLPTVRRAVDEWAGDGVPVIVDSTAIF